MKMKASQPDIIVLPVLLNCQTELNPVMINERPTYIALCDNFIEISLYYEYEYDKLTELDVLDRDQAWKQSLVNENIEREIVKVYSHIIIRREKIGSIQMQYSSHYKMYYIEFNVFESPQIYVSHEQGVDLFNRLVEWWKK